MTDDKEKAAELILTFMDDQDNNNDNKLNFDDAF